MGILTAAAGSFVSEIVKYTAIVRHIGYSFCFKKMVRDLTEEKVRLEQRKQVIHDTIYPGVRNNTEVVNPNVQAWLTNVDRFIEEVQTLENLIQEDKMCCMGCPDWIWRYKLGKEATEKTEKAAELFQEAAGWDLNQLTHRAPLPDIVTFSSNDDYEVFESRKFIFEELMEALRDDNYKRIGLHGLGGVGKTTLVMDVCKKAKDLFSDIVMTTVSQTSDIRKIQGEIADCLHLTLGEESNSGRAKRIWLRIKQAEKKILVILDDVWKEVKLGDIGIPSGEDPEKCKILLTTRSEHVCDLMHCSKKILLKFLSEEESLALIKKNASIFYDSPALNDVVKKVVEECKGLPVAIVTVGKALTGKSLDDWKEALQQLRKSRIVDIYGVDEEKNAYSCLKWSYNHLKCKAKLCFLLCSLFPEDYNIEIEELTRYAMGLEEYEDVNSVDEARSQVRVAINQLQDSSLLLKCYTKHYVRMHDMVRDVGLWIASKGENEFKLRACTHLLEKSINFERVTTISLMASNTKQLPDKLVCPRLKILFLGRIEGSKKISNTFFEGLNCLKVLRLEEKILSSHSLQFLTNLQSLYLKICDFSDNLSSLGKLKRLKTLSFYRCRMVALPNELGEMESLRLLDLRDCDGLKRIPQNVIQRLSRLEELIWDVKGTSNANLPELNSLPCLVFLSLSLWLKYLPQGFVFPSLQRYRICINCVPHIGLTCTPSTFFNSRILEINDLNSPSITAFKVLFCTVEYLWIQSCEMECIFDTTRENRTGMFANLIKLHLMEMSCLRTICEGPNHDVIFSNLTYFVAKRCKRLVSLFSPSLAQSLKRLKALHLLHCNELKQIISEDEGMILESHSQPICLPELQTIYVKYCPKLEYIFPLLVARDLPQLERLKLEDLPQLKQVFDHEKEGDVRDGNSSSVWPSLKDLKVVNCPKMKLSFFADLEANVPAHGKLKYLPQGFVFPSLQRYHICINHYHYFSYEETRTKCFDLRVLAIKELNVFSMNAFKVLFRTVEYIWIESCEMECIVDTTSRGDHTVMFANLIKLHLVKMSCLRTICEGPNHYVIFSNLTDFVADGCTRLVSLFSPSLAQSLKKLKKLHLVHCNELKQIISEDEGMILESHSQPICLPELQSIQVCDCGKLEYIFPLLVARDLPQLESLELEDLPQLKQVFDHEKEGDVRDGNNSSVWPSLKDLKVVKCPKMKLSFFADLEANVPGLGKLKISQTCGDNRNALSILLMQGLLTLEELEIRSCGGLLEVFKLEGLLTREGEQQNQLLPRLKEIFLHDLLELRCIWKGPTQYLNLDNLEELEVFSCNKLKHLFTPILARSLQSLKWLEIRTCDEVEYLIAKDEEDQILSENHLQPLYFPKLKVVSVKGCNKLKYLFPITMANSLLQLTILKVKRASQLAEVFTNEDKGDIVVQKDVRLPRIFNISLEGLPSLVNFCPRNYHAILPKLYSLKVQRCPNMTSKFTRTPDKSVHINEEVPQVDEEDEPTGFSTNTSVVTLWPPNKDEGDADNDANLMGRKKLTFGYQKWLRVKEEDDHVEDSDDLEEDDHVEDSDDLESDDRKKLTFGYQKWLRDHRRRRMRVKEEDDHVEDSDDLEWDDADLMGRKMLTFGFQKFMRDWRRRARARRMRMRMKEEDDHVEYNYDSESDDTDYKLLDKHYNLLESDDTDYNLSDDTEWSEDDDNDDQPKE